MNTAFQCYLRQRGESRTGKVIDEVMTRHKEACMLRLARIANGKEPSHKNGHGTKKG